MANLSSFNEETTTDKSTNNYILNIEERERELELEIKKDKYLQFKDALKFIIQLNLYIVIGLALIYINENFFNLEINPKIIDKDVILALITGVVIETVSMVTIMVRSTYEN